MPGNASHAQENTYQARIPPLRNHSCLVLIAGTPLPFYRLSCGGSCVHRKDTLKMKKKRLGEVLYERGQISAADLKKALLDQQGRVIHLGELLLERKLVPKQDLLAAIAEVAGVPYQDCSAINPSPETLRLIP